MLCMQRAQLAGTQKPLHKPHSGDYVTWNTGQGAESHGKQQSCCGKRSHAPVGNTQIGSASLQGVRKGLLNQG